MATRTTDLQGRFTTSLTIGAISDTNKKVVGYDNSNSKHHIWQIECLKCHQKIWTASTAFYKKCKHCGDWFKYDGKTDIGTPETYLHIKYRGRAKIDNINFSLTNEEVAVLVRGNCYYCGVEPRQVLKMDRKYHNTFLYNGIDRKHNDIGYVYSNCVSCCWKCNQAKRAYPLEEWKSMVRKWAETVDKW